MSVELEALVARLEELEHEAQLRSVPPRSVLVTFDDGWIDPLQLASHFSGWRYLQPLLLLTMRQMQGDRGLLPLPRLYAWCAETGVSLATLEQQGLQRQVLKGMTEKAQHELLDRYAVPRIDRSPETLSLEQVREIVKEGWWVGSHGHDHHDLRVDAPTVLEQGLQEALQVTLALGGRPWLAWPEGRCTVQTCEIARKVGFQRQFSLRVETGGINRVDVVHRDIWR